MLKFQVNRREEHKVAGRIDRYLAEGTRRGWDMDRWRLALKDTTACRDVAVKLDDPIARMTSFIDCRKGKRLPPKGA